MTIEIEKIMTNKLPTPAYGSVAPDHIINKNETLKMGSLSTVENQTQLQQFYSNESIFITGGTGFLGKILVEKLLRACSNIRCIYMLVRSKKGKNMISRIEDIFDDPIFDRLRKEQPKFRHKIHGISGDCSLPNLGLSETDIQLLKSEATIVFHVAATVRFDEKLKFACAVNVIAPRDLIQICHNMKHLKSFVHVSTAFAHCPLSTIEEKFYPPPMDSKKLITLVESMPDSIADHITPVILGKWPNTYAYAKSIAEDVFRQDAVNLPVGIFRPAIVISSANEPLPGWIDNMYGPTGVCAAASTGVMRTLHCDSDAIANVVPVDLCVNGLIAAAHDITKRHANVIKQNKSKTSDDIPIYNYVSSVEQPVTWGSFMKLSEQEGVPYPSIKAIYYYSFTLNKNIMFHWLYMIFLHYLPAILIDGGLMAIGKQPRFLKLYRKIHRFMLMISYFATRNWTFTNDNTQQLWRNLSTDDQQLFFFSINQLNWKQFFETYMLGIRTYLMKDPVSTMEEARKKWDRLHMLHLFIKYLFYFIVLRLCWYIFSNVFSILPQSIFN